MKNIRKQKTENNDDENKKFDRVYYHCGRKEYMSWDCRKRKYGNIKKYEKLEKAIDGDEGNLLLCSLTMKNKKDSRFVEDVKQSSEAGMICTINRDTFISFTNNSWIGDSGAL